MTYRIELISGLTFHGGQGISALLAFVCNIHFFLKLWNRKFQKVSGVLKKKDKGLHIKQSSPLQKQNQDPRENKPKRGGGKDV